MKMDLMQRIAKFLEENSELSIEQANEELNKMDLRQEELSIIIRVGYLEKKLLMQFINCQFVVSM